MATLRRGNNKPLTLGQWLGAGGEAAVYAVVGEPALVAKLYHQPTALHAAKLRAMIANPPREPARLQGHRSLAWPADLILDTRGTVVGFLMPRIDFATSAPLLKLYNPQDREQTAPGFTWEYLLRTASNIASVVEVLHAHGYVIGDLNESNLFVTDRTLVTLVDCDSMQVPGPAGALFRCLVGKAEYTPPELQGQDFAAVNRGPSADNFGLAILTFMLLMEGVHPFAGVWRGAGTPPPIETNIKNCRCPYTQPKALAPPPYAPSFTILPPRLQALTLRCFGTGCADPAQRPTAQEWHQALQAAEQGLVHCKINSQHVYSAHLTRCPWCQLTDRGIPDPFPRAVQHTPLPLVPPHRTDRPDSGRGRLRVQTLPMISPPAPPPAVRPARSRRFSVVATLCALLNGFGATLARGQFPSSERPLVLAVALIALFCSVVVRPLFFRYSAFGLAAILSGVEFWRLLQQQTRISEPRVALGVSILASLAGLRYTWGRLAPNEQKWTRRIVLGVISICAAALVLHSQSLGA